MPKDMRTEKHHQNDFAILGRTYETNLTCCLWNALIVYPELAALSTPNIVFSAKYPIFARRTAQIIFLTTCASEKTPLAPQTCAPTVRALPRSAILFKNKERRKALFVFD